MKLELERGNSKTIEKGDVIILNSGVAYLVIEGDYSDEYVLVNLDDFTPSTSEESISDIVYMDDIVEVIKSNRLVLGVI